MAALSTDPIDLLLDVDGELVIDSDAQFSTGLDAVVQGCRLRLQLFRGEWFLNLDEGVPYYQDILGQKYNEQNVRAAFRNALVSVPNVDSIIRLELDFNRGTRVLTVTWQVRTAFGDSEAETLEV